MAEIPKLIAVHGLPVRGAEGFYATTGKRMGRIFNGVTDFVPDYTNGNLNGETTRLADVVNGVLDEGMPVAILALSGGVPVAVSTLSLFPPTDQIRIVGVSGRLNTAHRPNYRTLDQIRQNVGPLLPDAVASVGDVSAERRVQVASYRVKDGDELVHPDMTILAEANNVDTGLVANHAEGIAKIVWQFRDSIVGFLGGSGNPSVVTS